jgi:hypothetical protein
LGGRVKKGEKKKKKNKERKNLFGVWLKGEKKY